MPRVTVDFDDGHAWVYSMPPGNYPRPQNDLDVFALDSLWQRIKQHMLMDANAHLDPDFILPEITVDLVQQAMLDCHELEHNWLAGFLLHVFGYNRHVSFWNTYEIMGGLPSGSIVVFADEQFPNTALADMHVEVLKHSGSVVVTGSRDRASDLANHHIPVVFFPWVDWFFHLISVRRIGLPISRVPNTTKIFNFLNRRWRPVRLHAIEWIFRHHPDLLDTGYITASMFSYYADHPKLHRDQEFMTWYQPDNMGFERNNVEVHGHRASINAKNLYYIAEHVPGIINIQVDSCDQIEGGFEKHYTEKSMTALATQQIPIIISHEPGTIQLLRDNGFDVFDDIIDHAYDREPDQKRRCELAIDLNRDRLSGVRAIPDITARLQHNQQYLLGQWCDCTLLRLIQDINSAFKSIKGETHESKSVSY